MPIIASTERSTFRVRMTRASPTAATATIEARTATWLMFETVRNCGAETETRPPSTNMIASRLSSRWRAIAASHDLRVRRGAAAAAVMPDSTTGTAARLIGHDRRLGVAHLARRGEHD